MTRDNLRLLSSERRPPLYSSLAAFAASCFFGTLVTDITYWQTMNIVWGDFSAWLVTIGVVAGYLTILVALVEIFVFRAGRFYGPTCTLLGGLIVAMILATFNMFVHTRDAWTSVVPWGIGLSAAVTLVVLVTGWMTRERYEGAGAEVTF